MRFMLDQSSDARLVPFLNQLGHDAIRVGRDHPPGLADVDVLRIAYEDDRILITDDRDFGELVFRQRQPQADVIYLRLGHYVSLDTATSQIEYVLTNHQHQLNRFLVVTPDRVRVRSS